MIHEYVNTMKTTFYFSFIVSLQVIFSLQREDFYLLINQNRNRKLPSLY